VLALVKTRNQFLALWAYALLTVLRAVPRPTKEAPKKMWPQPPPEQLGDLQGCVRTAVRLSVGEIRRLFWGLVLATQQRVQRMLAWSTWRRWHQGIAKYWHAKRRPVS